MQIRQCEVKYGMVLQKCYLQKGVQQHRGCHVTPSVPFLGEFLLEDTSFEKLGISLGLLYTLVVICTKSRILLRIEEGKTLTLSGSFPDK